MLKKYFRCQICTCYGLWVELGVFRNKESMHMHEVTQLQLYQMAWKCKSAPMKISEKICVAEAKENEMLF